VAREIVVFCFLNFDLYYAIRQKFIPFRRLAVLRLLPVFALSATITG